MYRRISSGLIWSLHCQKLRCRKLLCQSMMGALVLPALLAFPALASASSADGGQPAQEESVAETVTETATTRRSRRRILRPDPPRRQRPPNQVQPGGGLDVAAQACVPGPVPLTALVPVENPVLTMRDYPTFLFYLPDAPEAVDYVEFILLSADEKEEIHSVQFSPTAPGIVSVTLPAEPDKALEPGEAYHWYLNLHCETTVGIPSVNGWVERVEQSPLEEDAMDSALPEVWYDAIAQMAATLQRSPTPDNNALSEWSELLTAAGLDELIGIPVLGPIFRSEVAVFRTDER